MPGMGETWSAMTTKYINISVSNPFPNMAAHSFQFYPIQHQKHQNHNVNKKLNLTPFTSSPVLIIYSTGSRAQ